MKTVEELIFEKRFKDAIFNPNDFNDWAKENEHEAYNLCLLVAKQLESDRKLQNKRLVYEFAKHFSNVMNQIKPTHGGKRKGAGRPKLKKSDKKEPTKTIRVPISKIPAIMEVINMGQATVKMKSNPIKLK